MDRISDSGSDDLGSIPNGGTSRTKMGETKYFLSPPFVDNYLHQRSSQSK